MGLSMISDNVFVAAAFHNELTEEVCKGEISRDDFNLLSLATLSGTNILGIATPNGQAAFLFLYTSVIAPIVGLTYTRMIYLAIPYTITLSLAGWLSIFYAAAPYTTSYLE